MGQVTNELNVTRDKDMWKVMIAYTQEQGT